VIKGICSRAAVTPTRSVLPFALFIFTCIIIVYHNRYQ
jgi:hypothetical protein